MYNDLEKVLLTEQEIEKMISGMGKQISEDYKDKNLLLISVLKGSVVFMSDLMRSIKIPCKIDFMSVSSYGSGTESTGHVKIIKDLDIDLAGYDLLIVEDILDSGNTLYNLKNLLLGRNPKSVKICTFLDKPARRTADIKADYVGIEVPDDFVVGYGLDYNENYRNLPCLGILKRSVYEN